MLDLPGVILVSVGLIGGGGVGNVTITGVTGDDMISGGKGNDHLRGALGTDTLNGAVDSICSRAAAAIPS